MTKNIAILGSTGSIGKNALRVIQALGQDYRVTAISANSNVDLLADQTKNFQPELICLANPENYNSLKEKLADFKGKILTGPKSLIDIATLDKVDIVITAVVGAAGLPAVLEAAKKGKTLAIANKEPFVIAGEMLTKTAKQNNAAILPVDSEHSAIFQCLQAGNINEVNKIILTASGGPFRKFSPDQIENVTLKQALEHPTWNMGPKITIDSATMMNKALEIIEAVWLFGTQPEKISVLIHPESIVHSMVEFIDGSVVAQMGTPDMTLPIQYALTYPKRAKGITNRLKLDELGTLNFEKPNLETFRAIKLGFQVAKKGGSLPVVFNAANEQAVEQFLAGRIGFASIIRIIEHCLEKHNSVSCVSLEQLFDIDTWARAQVLDFVSQKT
ncbi:MAG: 1-deoxy-D-xylulose-5-phosphate reductoisomerase [Sedimentisphaerales bacterium]|nr:1-deoxy-D-xylulose-5-phosphate reductoisomerase [Sedimentisphaerales bacterium]